MSSNITELVNELKNINIAIKNYRKQIADLKKRGTTLEKNILTYLNEKDQPGVKHQNVAIIIENKPKKVKNKQTIEKECMRILQENGITNPKLVLNQITETKKGESIGMQKIKIQDIEKKKNIIFQITIGCTFV